MSAQKPRPTCPHCRSSSDVYHWWWCNATDEYLAWMKNHGAGEAFAGEKYNQGEQ